MPSPPRIIDDLWAERSHKREHCEPPQFLDPDFPEQSTFITDPAKLKVGFCTRRSGKSYGDGRYLLKEAYETPSVSTLYLALTRDTAENIMWRDVLRRLDRELGLNARPNKTKLELTLPNESTVRLLGMDADEEEKRKVLGGKYKLVIIDEAAKWRTNLRTLVFEYLKPAVADYRGTIALTSTSSEVLSGLFFELTEGHTNAPHRWMREGFSCHAWNWRQNPYMRKNIAEEIAELEAANPRVRETPGFRRMYDPGEWVIDLNNLVYKYMRERNDFDGELPRHREGRWHYVLGVDLGFEDPDAFTVLAYHDHDPCLYVLESYKTGRNDVTATSLEINAIKRRYDIEHTTIDGSSKKAVEEMNNRHGVMATPAEKTEKAEHIDLMNADFNAGRIKLSPKCGPLREEYGALVWDERVLERRHKREEHPGCDNHAADSAYYGWRHCYQYIAKTLPPAPPKMSDPDFYAWNLKRQQDEIAAQFERQMQANRNEQRESANELDWL